MHFADGPVRANVYTLLVGESGEAQKSTALRIGRTILFDAAASLIGGFPGSPEGMFEMLSEQNSMCMVISEFGRLLSGAEKGYMMPIKTLLTDLWDADPTDRTKANNKKVRIDNPRLSIMAGCSIPYLEKHTLAEDWTGGFMGRWMILYANRERTVALPKANLEYRPALVNFLKERATTPSAGWCMGLDDAAETRWTEWFNDVTNRNLPRNILGIRARAPIMALKTALLYGWDFGPASQGHPWRISLAELNPAIAYIEMHIKSLVSLSFVIADHPDARLRRTVVQTIRELDRDEAGVSGQGPGVSLGAILLNTKMRKRPIAEMLDALVESGTVVRLTSAEGVRFRLSQADAL